MGFTAKDTLQIINKGMKDGAFNTDKLADGVKEFNLRLSEVGKDQEAALGSLNMNVKDVTNAFNQGGEAGKNMALKVAMELMKVEDETERNQLAVAMFGTMYEDVGDSVVTALTSITDSSIDVEGKTNDVKAAFEETFGAEVNGIMQEMKEPLIEIAEKGLIPILETASDLITEFAEWFSGLDEGTIQTIAKMGLITMAIAPVLSLISNGIGIVGGLTGGFKGLAGSSGLLTTAMGILSGPVGIGLAMAALVGLMSYIGDSENIIFSLQEKLGGLGTYIAAGCEYTSGMVQLTIGNTLSWIQLAFDVIGAMIDGPGGATIEDAWKNHTLRINDNMIEGVQKITLTTTRGMSQMRHATEESLNGMLNVFRVTLSEIPGITEGEYGLAANKLAGHLQFMDNTQFTILRGMNDTTGHLFRGIRENMTVSEQTKKIQQNLKEMAAAGKLDTESFSQDIQSAMETMSQQLDTQTSKGSQQAIENTSTMSDEIIKSTDELNQQSSEDVQEMSDEIIKSANQMQESATNSTRSMRDHVTNATNQMANQAISDWDRIRGAYSRSISGSVRVTTYNDSGASYSTAGASAYEIQTSMLSRESLIDISKYRITGGYYQANSVKSNNLRRSSNSDKELTNIKSLLTLLINKLDESSEGDKTYLLENHVYLGDSKFIKTITKGVLKEMDREQRGMLLSPVR